MLYSHNHITSAITHSEGIMDNSKCMANQVETRADRAEMAAVLHQHQADEAPPPEVREMGSAAINSDLQR